jgi:hypothetical protein
MDLILGLAMLSLVIALAVVDRTESNAVLPIAVLFVLLAGYLIIR